MLRDDDMKFREVVLWVRAPSGQSIASRPVARLAATSAMARLMRRQANDWATGNQPRNCGKPGAQGISKLERSSLGGARASRRGSSGAVECGTAEEDNPVTWETLTFSSGKYPGHGVPVNKSDETSVRESTGAR
jgi:hypothetical protein